MTFVRLRPDLIEIERELNRLAEQGQQAVSNLNRLNELMAESRLLELEITQQTFSRVFTDEQRERMAMHIEEFRRLTNKGSDGTIKSD